MLRYLTRTLICKPPLVSRGLAGSIPGILTGKIGQKSVSTSARPQSKRQSSTNGTRSWKEQIVRLGLPVIGLSLAGYIAWRCHRTASHSIAGGRVDEIRHFFSPSEANAEEVKDMSNAERAADILDETRKIAAKFPDTFGEIALYLRLCDELRKVLVDNMIRAVMINHILLGINRPDLSEKLLRMIPKEYFTMSIQDHGTVIRKNLETIYKLDEDVVKAYEIAMMSEPANELRSCLVQALIELDNLMDESIHDSDMAQRRCADRLRYVR